jgi:large subunit ribosomal protein L19e
MKNKRQLAAKVLKVSPSKIKVAEGAEGEVSKAITRSDIRGLIAVGKIQLERGNLHSRARARKNAKQKRKGRRVGRGSKKGSMYAHASRKRQWVDRIRAQRQLLKELREKGLVSQEAYQSLYAKSSGGFFRNRRHIKLYLSEHSMIEKAKSGAKAAEQKATAKQKQ